MSADSSAPAAAAPATTSVPEVEGHRVYVGNLAFNATEEQVREHFTKVGGEIVQVLLPTRYKSRRPAGYAFVTFKNEADAKKAVETLNETEIGERKIQLELARSKEENAERRQEMLEKRRKTQEATKPVTASDATTSDPEKGADKPKKKKAAKKTGRRRGPEDGDETAVEPEEAEAKSKPKKTKAKAPAAKEARIDGAEGDKATEAKEPKEPKERKPRLALTGEVSKNTVFVANLPFNIDDEALTKLFSEVSIKVKTAHVIRGLRKLPGRRPFRGSKGFGFVELEDPSQQDEAVEKINGSTVGDRKVTAKVAQEMKAIEEIEAAEAKAEDKAEVKTEVKEEKVEEKA